MTAFWPSSLPDIPAANGYSETPIRPKVRFESEVGPPIMRRRGTVKMSIVSVMIRMTLMQIQTFEAFVDENASDGQAFCIKHPRTGSQVEARLIGDQPYGLEPIVPGLWAVTFELLIQ